MKKITRLEASVAGEKKFFTGKKCVRGHRGERWVVSGSCVDCCRVHSQVSVSKYRMKLKDAARLAKRRREQSTDNVKG